MAESEAAPEPEDPYLWLEEVEGTEALDWVKARNETTLAELTSDARFADYEATAKELLTASDRIPYGALRGEHVYNFWQDETHVRGIWRRAAVDSYLTDAPDWEVLLDLDVLAEEEGENWVWAGSNCLPPDYTKCLISLSRGGADAATEREFDVATKSFVADGFVVPEAKSGVAWIDADTLLVATDWGEGSLTTSGYPRIIKRWQRGTPLTSAETMFEGEAADVGNWPTVIHRPDGTYAMTIRSKSFFDQDYIYFPEEGEAVTLPLPKGADFQGIFKGQVLFSLREPLTIGEGDEATAYPAGTLLSAVLSEAAQASALPPVKKVFQPTERQSLGDVAVLENDLLMTTLDNVAGTLRRVIYKDDRWRQIVFTMPDNGSIRLVDAESFGNRAFATFQSYLVPDQLYLVDAAAGSRRPIKALPPRFDAEGLMTQQFEAVSADGTKIPYFIVHPEEIAFDGQNPTILYGYGGFEIPLTPGYNEVMGKLWLEQGNVYVVANIRGGGEFGPSWHRAALLKNRQRAYDDFIAVAEDLIARGVTSPDHLGIYGGSNGGLLVGAVMVQRPDLFDAVVSAVPLLDMIRYTELPPGASWMAEYGDPTDPAMRAVIERYSPYQNVEEEGAYPRVFFMTSTRDDRVHPGHARKMAKKMIDQGHPILYYENIEGGHGGSANLDQAAFQNALRYVYFSRQLKDENQTPEGGTASGSGE